MFILIENNITNLSVVVGKHQKGIINENIFINGGFCEFNGGYH